MNQERALNAKLVLENQAFHEALEDLEKGLLGEWKSTHPEAWKQRERVYERLQALLDVKAQLQNYLHTAALS